MSNPTDPDDPYNAKMEDREVLHYVIEEVGEDGGGKYIKYKSKEKDEEGKEKVKFKMYKHEMKDG